MSCGGRVSSRRLIPGTAERSVEDAEVLSALLHLDFPVLLSARLCLPSISSQSFNILYRSTTRGRSWPKVLPYAYETPSLRSKDTQLKTRRSLFADETNSLSRLPPPPLFSPLLAPLELAGRALHACRSLSCPLSFNRRSFTDENHTRIHIHI